MLNKVLHIVKGKLIDVIIFTAQDHYSGLNYYSLPLTPVFTCM